MKILALSDVESKFLWDYFDKNFFSDIDLILCCGDLDAAYLTFLATMCKARVVYVPGNHDKKYLTAPPEGCICADDRLVKVNGLRIVGLGGSMKYKEGPYQYTPAEMKKRASALYLPIMMNHGFDILLTHAPAQGLGDAEDLPHQGFEAFNKMIHAFHPKMMVHGHVHLTYGYHLEREQQWEGTRIINAYEKYIIEL